MAGFKFRYEKVLQLRQDEENEKKQLLAEKISDLTRLRDKVERLKSEKKKNDEIILQKLSGGVNSADLSLIQNSKRWFRNEIKHYQELIVLAENTVKIARNDLMNATQELKKMEKLKEKAFKEYNEIEEKEFSDMIDGVINYQAVIKK